MPALQRIPGFRPQPSTGPFTRYSVGFAQAPIGGANAPLHPRICCLTSHDAGTLGLSLAAVIPSEEQLSGPPNRVAEIANQLFSLLQKRRGGIDTGELESISDL